MAPQTLVRPRCYGQAAYDFCLEHQGMYHLHCVIDRWCAPPAENVTRARAARQLTYMIGIYNKMLWIEEALSYNVSVMWIVSGDGDIR